MIFPLYFKFWICKVFVYVCITKGKKKKMSEALQQNSQLCLDGGFGPFRECSYKQWGNVSEFAKEKHNGLELLLKKKKNWKMIKSN